MAERDLAADAADYTETWVRRGAHRIYARTAGPAGRGRACLASPGPASRLHRGVQRPATTAGHQR